MKGRLVQGDRPKDPNHPDANPARGGNPSVFIPVETRNGRPFKPYVYRGNKPISAPGFCKCGCGELAPISTRTDKRYGAVKGKPRDYIKGHHLAIPGRKAA